MIPSRGIKEDLEHVISEFLEAVHCTPRVRVNQALLERHLEIKWKITEDLVIYLKLLHPVHIKAAGNNLQEGFGSHKWVFMFDRLHR